MAKRILTVWLRYLLHFELVYNLVNFLSYQSQRAIKQSAGRKFVNLLAPQGSAKVLRGPFRGMVYPQMQSFGSELAPKIIGSYESELHSVLERICKKEYACVVDIGAAEGYYAVGLALRMPNIRVEVFETNAQAIELCKHMATVNKVDGRIEFNGECDLEQLAQLEFRPDHKGFVICDCEGCELEILNPERIPQLLYCDLLVEVHDCTAAGPSSFSTLSSRFSRTHEITPINIKKRDPGLYPELTGLNHLEKSRILSEQRIHSVGWLFIETNSC